MGNQSAKFIDVTKSFIPIDPMAFPESLHTTGRDEAPETRIPASAYQGYNFLPTSYGYKSYFGTNGSIGVDAITSRADFVFTFQTETFENLLIALCEDGIWIKNGGTAGAWTHAKVIVPPVDPEVHFEWTYVIISDVLYCYQRGQAQFQKIASLATTPYYTLTDVTPTFLNMAGQVGIFRAGGMLGFWDTADSVSWSNLDDTGDFVPSIETLAGNVTFSDVNGRIVTILPHGEGFMIYASKSIVYIQEALEGTFEWKPKVVLSNSGIAYPQECCYGVPDTVHFAYTNTGLYKIDSARAEIIVPEVTDFLKTSKTPLYVRILQGRYLFLQTIDPDYLNGLVQFSDEEVPEDAYAFPGGGTMEEAVDDIILRGTSICNTIAGANDGEFDEQQPGGTYGGPAIPDQKPGTKAKPIWKCYISNNSVLDPDDLTFGQVPCAVVSPNGVPINLCPIGDSGRLDAMTQDSTKKTPLLGSDVYVDGIWTIERFIAVQTAIWEKQQANASALIDKILNRAGTGSLMTEVGSCVESQPAPTECTIGDYVAAYSAPQFGLSACQFWLTRYALSVLTIKAVQANIYTCTLVPAHSVSPSSFGQWRVNSGPYSFSTASAACNSLSVSYPITVADVISTSCCLAPTGSCSSVNVASRQGTCPVNYTPVSYSEAISGVQSGTVDKLRCDRGDYYERVQTLFAYNKGVVKEIAPVPETAYCEIIGWTYTKNDNTTGTVAAVACAAPAVVPKNGTALTNPLPSNPKDSNSPFSSLGGTVCSKPFEDVIIPGVPPTSVDWPDQTVEFPPSSFLLQVGSIAPVYPTFFGALVYDLQLKKWGKMKMDYKQLLDYQPLNTQSGGGIPYNRFGILGGVLKSNGKVYLFDDKPSDSNITYGKIGYYRLGMTAVEEVRVHFKSLSTGTLTAQASLDGRLPATGLFRTEEFTNAYECVLYGGFSGRWHNLTIAGIFDIQYLEYRGFAQGKR